MTLTLITASEGIPSEADEIIVSESAKPWLALAGYIHESEIAHKEVSTP